MPKQVEKTDRPEQQTHAAVVQPAPAPAVWGRLQPRTLVNQAVDAIIAGAARGSILPGDRIVEAEIARALGISRVPVREALRLLESQGLVVNEAYKGIRLMSFTPERLKQALEVRVALEATAVRRLLSREAGFDDALKTLARHVDAMELLATRQDVYGCASTDTAFHREICQLSGNEVIGAMWEQLARQITIIVGLSTLGKPLRVLVQEHRALLDALASCDMPRIERALQEHILTQNEVIDFERLIEDRRRKRTAHVA